MSKIPYRYRTPIPMIFWKNGDLDPSKKIYKNRLSFLTWAFSECHYDCFEFSCSREQAAIKSGMTEKEWRTQEKHFISTGLLTKKSNPIHDRLSYYEWNIEEMSEEKIIEIKEMASQINPQVIENEKHTSFNDKEMASQIEKGPAKGPAKGPVVLREEIQKNGQQKGQPNGHVYINNININKKTTTPLPPKGESVVVSFYPCLEENKDLSFEHKQILQQYPENRVKLALDYAKVTKPTDTLIAMLRWHCGRDTPPKPKASRFTEQQKYAFEINDYILSLGRKDLFDQNEKLILENGYMLHPRAGSSISVSILVSMETIRSDFKELKEIYGNKRKVG